MDVAEDRKYVAWAFITALAVLLHLVALYYLLKIYKRNQNMRTCQFNCLINLAAAELVRNLIYLLYYIMILVTPKKEFLGQMISECLFLSQIKGNDKCKAQNYLLYQAASSATYCYFFAMFLLTGDRLLAVLMTFRYKSVCTIVRVRIVIIFTWFLCFCVNLPVTTGYYFDKGYAWLRMGGGQVITRTQLFYIPAVLSIGFVIFSCVTYIIMFVVYVKSRRMMQQGAASESLFRTFINSSFYISVVLITSFLVLTVVPTLVNVHYDRLEIPVPEPVVAYIYSSMHLSDVADAVIYILLYRPVQRMLICFRGQTTSTGTATTTTGTVVVRVK